MHKFSAIFIILFLSLLAIAQAAVYIGGGCYNCNPPGGQGPGVYTGNGGGRGGGNYYNPGYGGGNGGRPVYSGNFGGGGRYPSGGGGGYNGGGGGYDDGLTQIISG